MINIHIGIRRHWKLLVILLTAIMLIGVAFGIGLLSGLFNTPDPVIDPLGYVGIQPAILNNSTSPTMFAYVVGNTSETDGYPAYEGPGVAQNQSMPQYFIVVINPVGNTSASISLGSKVLFSGQISGAPFLHSFYTNATGAQTLTVTMHSYAINQTVTDIYSIQFMLVSAFIHYEQKKHPSTSSNNGISAGFIAGVSIVAILLIVPIGFSTHKGFSILMYARYFIDKYMR